MLTPITFAWALGLVLCCITLYRFWFHPLAQYPGPIAAKLSGFYMPIQALRGRNTFVRHSLHQQFGPIVRVGPNELSFCDMDSIKNIYGQSSQACPKAPEFYGGFTLTGMESVFSATDRTDHGRMRRLLSHGFSQNGVLQFQTEIGKSIGLYLSKITASSSSSSEKKPVELYDLTHSLFLDITSQLGFAASFDTLRGQQSQGAEDIETYFQISPLFGLWPVARYLPFGIFGAARKAQPRIIRETRSWIDSCRSRLGADVAGSSFLRLMIQAKDSETSTRFSDAELVENAVLFVTAGSSTSATTVLYLLYETGKRPDIQRRLEQEIREAFQDLNKLPDFETASRLPYLNCVLQEVLRLRGPLNSVAPRVSPGKIISGQYIRPGTVVSNLSYTTHRDPAVFVDPEQFDPARWENATTEMRTMYRPFSMGPRNCLGMHLARVQVLLTICALYQRFDLRLDPSLTDDEMSMRDVGLMTPSGRTLRVHVSRRD